jgi:hypothetical protein
MPAELLAIEIGDWPGGVLIASTCQFPDAPDGGLDISTDKWCHDHTRTVHWCLNAGVFWCDGGPPDYEYHLMEFAPLP